MVNTQTFQNKITVRPGLEIWIFQSFLYLGHVCISGSARNGLDISNRHADAPPTPDSFQPTHLHVVHRALTGNELTLVFAAVIIYVTRLVTV